MTLTGPRDIRDARRLAELEVVITDGMGSFVAVGEALLEVRDSKLYRIGYETFEAYCKGRWSFTDRRARQLMEATEAVKALPTGTTVPVNEAQARELAAVVRDHGPEVAAGVMAEASAGGLPTADKVRAAAAPFRPRLDPMPYFQAPKPDPTPDYIEQMPPALAAEELEFRQRGKWGNQMYAALSALQSIEPTDYIDLLDSEERGLTEQRIDLIESWISRTRKAMSGGLRVIGGKR